MIITCPFCQTRYQVARDAIGSAGRKVQCAHCLKDWKAVAEAEKPAPPKPKLVPPPAKPVARDDDQLFDDMDELGLDTAFVEAERAAAAPDRATEVGKTILADAPPPQPLTPAEAPEPPKPVADPASMRKQEQAYKARQDSIARRLPHAKMRRTARIGAFALLLAVVAGGLLLRNQVVTQFPEMAAVYDKLGLGVNVIGLDFRNVTTLRSRHQGAETMDVNAKIFSVADHVVAVPPVVVTLLDAQGRPIYEWSVTPPATELMPGDGVTISAQVTSPPPGADKVRLTFSGSSRLASSPAMMSEAEPTQHLEPIVQQEHAPEHGAEPEHH